MNQQPDPLFIRLPTGVVKGPFEARMVLKTWKAGKVPSGSCIGSTVDGPWTSAETFYSASWVAPTAQSPAPRASVLIAVEPAATVTRQGLAVREPAVSPTVRGFLKSCWSAFVKDYWAIVLRAFVGLIVSGALLVLPLVLALINLLLGQFLGQGDWPVLRRIQSNLSIIEYVSPILLVPFGAMFLATSVLLVLGVIESSDRARWSTLFEWRHRFVPMYVLGYVASATEIAALILSRLLAGRGGGESGTVARVVSEVIEACPIALVVLAGLAIMSWPRQSSVWITIKSAMHWAYSTLLRHKAHAALAIVLCIILASICAIFVIPFVFLGWPLLLVAIALVFRDAPGRDVGPQLANGG